MNKLLNLFNSQYFPLFIFGVCMLLIHLIAPIPVADDIIFQTRPKGIFDVSFYLARYEGWSSRIIIEFFTVVFLSLPSLFWRVINPIILVWLVALLSNIFIESNRSIYNWLLVFLLLIFPLREMLAGGWVTISLNYIWPLTFSLISLMINKRIIFNTSISLGYCLFSLLLLIFALNQEIISGIFLIIFLFINIYLIYNKRVHWYPLVCFSMSLISLVFIFSVPGNVVRSHVETRWFVDFHYISVVEKLEIGISSTITNYIFQLNMIFLILHIFIYNYISRVYEDAFFRFIALFPIVSVIVLGNVIKPIINQTFPHLSSIDPFLSKYGLITLGNYTQISTHIINFLLYVSFFMLFVLLVLVFGKTWKGVISIGVLSLGLISRLVLSFSPTVWASGLRTHFLLLTSFVIICVLVFKELETVISTKHSQNIVMYCGFVSIFSFLNTLLAL